MPEYLYRVMYRPVSGKWWNGDTSWHVHVGRKGTHTYSTAGAARGAMTQFRKRDAWRGRPASYDFKVQRAPVSDWDDV